MLSPRGIILLLIANLVLMCASSLAQTQCSKEVVNNLKKTALVIGESQYSNLDTLHNPAFDAQDVTNALKALHFNVKTGINIPLRGLKDSIDNWLKTLNQYDIAIFYFAGHGSEIDGKNYIYPIDAEGRPKSAVINSTYLVQDLLGEMEKSTRKVSIILLDACRDNPLVRSARKRHYDKGFANVASFQRQGVLVGFSTSPGKKTLDGGPRNGYYTKAFLEDIGSANTKLVDVFTKINDDCRIYSDGDQIPYISTSVGSENNYCLVYKERTATSAQEEYLSDTLKSAELNRIRSMPITNKAEFRHNALTTFNDIRQLVYNEIRPLADSLKNRDIIWCTYRMNVTPWYRSNVSPLFRTMLSPLS